MEDFLLGSHIGSLLSSPLCSSNICASDAATTTTSLHGITPKKLPYGFAAFTAFWIGTILAILCMSQTWWVEPIALAVGIPRMAQTSHGNWRWVSLPSSTCRSADSSGG